MNPLSFTAIWLAVASVAAFLIFARDKRAALKQARRTPERILLTWMLAGGAPGGLIAMGVFRHKIRKISFWICGGLATLDWGFWFWYLWQKP